jgi:hypothetical protein
MRLEEDFACLNVKDWEEAVLVYFSYSNLVHIRPERETWLLTGWDTDVLSHGRVSFAHLEHKWSELVRMCNANSRFCFHVLLRSVTII